MDIRTCLRTGHSSTTKRIPLFHNWKADTIDNRARVESLTFRLAPLIITPRRERNPAIVLNVDPTWSTPRVNRYARVNFTNIINGYPPT